MANAVLLGSPEDFELLEIARVLAGVLKVPLQDATTRAKRKWGILVENVDSSEAGRLAGQFQEAGLPVKVVPQDSLAILPEPQILSRTGGETLEKIAGERISLVAAAGFKRISTTTTRVEEGPGAGVKALKLGILVTTGLPLPLGRKRVVEKTQEQSELVFYLDVFLNNPPGRWRVDAQSFDYSFLKERKLYQILGNFRLLVGDIAARTPNALRNRGTRILLENKPIREMGYESLRDLEQESRWLLSL